jgi:hypothetical protein
MRDVKLNSHYSIYWKEYREWQFDVGGRSQVSYRKSFQGFRCAI